MPRQTRRTTTRTLRVQQPPASGRCATIAPSHGSKPRATLRIVAPLQAHGRATNCAQPIARNQRPAMAHSTEQQQLTAVNHRAILRDAAAGRRRSMRNNLRNASPSFSRHARPARMVVAHACARSGREGAAACRGGRWSYSKNF
ncbi:hypothetical protein F511_31808 [Dorcoceras hygrometricum]|uniref:Uncharacterized protein n=1 Tax=Dorcoceras hygrometricum TaxID=472368 RepID=A0A2Z7AFU8_9LAMI|nr:hypothetical protein F511_31808 [Dorcoceras hygrometricum]